MMLKYFDKTLDWNDANFYGFAWCNDGKDLELFLSHASENISGLMCSWVSNLIINLQWQKEPNVPDVSGAKVGGPLLIVSAGFNFDMESQFSVHLNFGSNGELSFECCAIKVL